MLAKIAGSALPVWHLTIEETATRLGYSRQTVAALILEGRLAAVNIALQPGKSRALYRVPENATVDAVLP